jgi:hypothetical protein
MNDTISKLPFIIIFYWVLSLICINTQWYIDNYIILDYLDYLPVCLCVFHFLLKPTFYNKTKSVLVYTIIAICIFQRLQLTLNVDLYRNIYESILILGICFALIINLNALNKE